MENGATDEERAEALQQWWQRWGRLIIVGVVIVVLAIVGVQLWLDHQASQAEGAAALYSRLQLQDGSGSTETADELGQRLMDEFSGTPYAALAALYRARVAADEGDFERAADLAEWAGERAEPSAVRPAAELRRARLLLELDRAGEAAELAAGVAEANPAHAATARAIEGDARADEGELKPALEAYRAAREGAEADAQKQLLDMKIDDLTSRLAAEES
ncbi:MAG: tetratricopeptide repeat protein [Thiohalospira sp.]